jgi:hypothetical protein
VRDFLNIVSTEKMLNIEIFNSSGMPVHYQDLQGSYEFKIDLARQPSGLYISRISLEGQKTIIRKFVLEK